MLAFDDLDAFVFGVESDSTSKHRNFIEKKDLGITLLFDVEKTVCQDYGIWQLKKFMDKEYLLDCLNQKRLSSLV